MEPSTLKNFKILNLIGEGSFGKVFKAVDNETKTVVALKILTKVKICYWLRNVVRTISILQLGRSSKDLVSLKQEADIHQSLSHPNIIRLVSSFETAKELVFVCEYAASDLHKQLAICGSLGEIKTQKLSCDLISALHYLHSIPIYHRDLKPPNILIDRNEKAKLCDFGLARNMPGDAQMLTSMKGQINSLPFESKFKFFPSSGTPLYMAPELLEGKRYNGSEIDLWSLGCIIYEMLAGETPFVTKNYTQLVILIRSKIKWPSFLSSTCLSFLQGLLVYNPKNRFTMDQILEHKFVKGSVYIKKNDGRAVQQSFDRIRNSASTAKIGKMKKYAFGTMDDINVMTSRDSIRVNLNLQSDLETDNEEVLLLKNEPDERSGDDTDKGEASDALDAEIERAQLPAQFHNLQQFQLEPPQVHNITNFQPVAENSNMVMHRFMDNVDPELQNFMMAPGMLMMQQPFAMFPPVAENPVQKVAQDLEGLSIRGEKSSEVPQPSLKKSQKTQSDGVSTDVSSIPVETEEWLQFLFRAMQEILDGDLEIYKQENMMMMIVELLRNASTNSKLIDHVVQIFCLPYAIDIPRSILDDIERLYLQIRIVPNLVFTSKRLCCKKLFPNISDVMTMPKVEGLIKFTESEVKTLSSIYELVVFLVYSGDAFLQFFCDIISLLDPADLFRSFIVCGLDGKTKDGTRLTSSILALVCAILQELPENANLIKKFIFHDDIDLCKMLRHDDAMVRVRTLLMLRLLGRFCCHSLQSVWSHEMSSCLEESTTDADDDVKVEARNTLEEFKDCFSWFRMESF